MYCSDRGFATSRAESLWLSGASNLREEASPRAAEPQKELDLTESRRLSARRAAQPQNYKFPRLYSSVMYSQARIVSARIVKVGLWFADDTKLAPSVTNTFFTSCIWLYLFSTELFGSLPMRAVPSSWMMRPGAVI